MAKDFKVGQVWIRPTKTTNGTKIEIKYKITKINDNGSIVASVSQPGGENAEGDIKTASGITFTPAGLNKILKSKSVFQKKTLSRKPSRKKLNESYELKDQGTKDFHPGFFSFEESPLDKSFINKLKQMVDYVASGDIALGRKVVNEAFDELLDNDDVKFEHGVEANVALDNKNDDWISACNNAVNNEDIDEELDDEMDLQLNSRRRPRFNKNQLRTRALKRRRPGRFTTSNDFFKDDELDEDFGAHKIDAGADRIRKLFKRGLISKEKMEQKLEDLNNTRTRFKSRSFKEETKLNERGDRYKLPKKKKLK